MTIENKIAVNALFNSPTLTETKSLDWGKSLCYTARLSLCVDDAEGWWVIERDSNIGQYDATLCDSEEQAEEMFTFRADSMAASSDANTFKAEGFDFNPY